MRKSRSQNWRRAAFLFCGVFFFATAAAADGVKRAQARLADLNQTITVKDLEIEKTSKELDQLSAEVHALKKKSTLLRPYRLQSRLREAQKVSDRLEGLTKEREESQKSYRKAQQALTQELDRAIELNRKVANSESMSWKERVSAARTLEGLLVQRMNHSSETPSLSLPTNAASLFQGENHQEDAEERLTALRDLERRMKNQIAALASDLIEARRQQFLRSELTHLIDEESFFAEQGFVRAALTRTDKTTTLVDPLAKGKGPEDSEIVAASGTPGGDTLETGLEGSTVPDPEVPDMTGDPNIDPLTEPVTGEAGDINGVEMVNPLEGISQTEIGTPAALGAMTNLGTPSVESNTETFQRDIERDPLARLASDFGLPPEQKRDIESRVAPTNGQIQWLENRISTIQWILKRLRFKTRELEQQTVRP